MNKTDYIMNVEKFCQKNGLKFVSTKTLDDIEYPDGLNSPYRFPKALGMVVHGIITDLPLDLLKKEADGTWYYDNPMRGDDSHKNSQEHIVKLQKIIREGNWRPESNINPTVKFEFETESTEIILVTGNHTAQAHYGCNEDVMWVVVVEFFEYRKLPAMHWEENWQSVENKDSDDYAKLVRTDDEIQAQVQRWIDDKRIEKAEDDITQALKDQECTETEITRIRNKLLKANNLTDSYVRPIDAKTLEQKREIYQKAHPDEIVITQGYDSENDEKYQAGVVKKLKKLYITHWKKFENGPAKIISKVKISKKAKIIKIRKSKDYFINDDIKLNIEFQQTRLAHPECPFRAEHLWLDQISEDKEDFIKIK